MKSWFFLMVTWLFVLMLGGLDILAPDAWWINVDRMMVSDAKVGEAPSVSVDMKFSKRFVAHWHATIRQARSLQEGDFVGVCFTDGEAQMSPERKFPAKIDIDWWMNPTKCHLGEGAYYVETIFRWDTKLSTRTHVVTSNMFRVVADSR